MKYLFAPGCALILYKPELVRRTHEFLNSLLGKMDLLLTCCQHAPQVPADIKVINVCPGCDRRFRENLSESSTISLWEVIAAAESFAFPNYKAGKMTIIDACPTRNQDRIHIAVRTLAEKMNISVVEPEKTRQKGTCCGDTFYGKIPAEKVKLQMQDKAGQMPLDDIIVYCVSCAKSMFVGERSPKYLVDLLFAEETIRGTYETDQWHREVDEFVDAHQSYQTTSNL